MIILPNILKQFLEWLSLTQQFASIREHGDFSNINISQGSVATYLRCCGIFKYYLVSNLPLSLPAKEL